MIHLADPKRCERGAIARLLHSLYTSRTLISGTAAWSQAAGWLREAVYAGHSNNDGQLAADFLADFLALRSEMGTLAAWSVLNSKVERAVLMLVLFAAGNTDPSVGCGEVVSAVDSMLK